VVAQGRQADIGGQQHLQKNFAFRHLDVPAIHADRDHGQYDLAFRIHGSSGEQAQAVLRETMRAFAFHADFDQGIRVVLGVSGSVMMPWRPMYWSMCSPQLSSSDLRKISTF